MTNPGCAACAKPDAGLAHTCAGSGTFRAAEAYAADMVDEISQAWPRFDIDIHFQMRATDETMVRDKLTSLVTVMLNDDLVENSVYTIKEKAEA